MKRLTDLLVAAVGLAISAPLLAAIALAIRTLEGAPVIFRQQRAGIGGRPFMLFKFRTMKPVGDGPPVDEALRLTAFGRWLRRASLDELPQLWNILRGDMSLVGPRPLPVQYVPRYSAEQVRRLHVRPGLTGWAQINGRNGLSWDSRLALDVWYVSNRTYALDCLILLRTVGCVLVARDVSPEGAPIMEEFLGPQK